MQKGPRIRSYYCWSPVLAVLILLLCGGWMCPSAQAASDQMTAVCPFKAKDLQQVLNWQQFPCSCCEKFCGPAALSVGSEKSTASKCDEENAICELTFGKCRTRQLKISVSTNRSLYAVLGMLLCILWGVTILLLARVAYVDEKRTATKELLLGKQRIESNDHSIDNWAVGLGIIFGVVSIVPFLMAVRLGRRLARKSLRHTEVRRKRTKTVGTFLGSFESPEHSPVARALRNARSVSPSPSPPASPPQRFGRSASQEIDIILSDAPSTKLPKPLHSFRPPPFAHVDFGQMDFQATPHYSLRSTFANSVRDETQKPQDDDESFWVPTDDNETVLDASKRALTRFFRTASERMSEIWKARRSSSESVEPQMQQLSLRMVPNDEAESSPQRLIRKTDSPLKSLQKRLFSETLTTSAPTSEEPILARANLRRPPPPRPNETRVVVTSAVSFEVRDDDFDIL